MDRLTCLAQSTVSGDGSQVPAAPRMHTAASPNSLWASAIDSSDRSDRPPKLGNGRASSATLNPESTRAAGGAGLGYLSGSPHAARSPAATSRVGRLADTRAIYHSDGADQKGNATPARTPPATWWTSGSAPEAGM